jgi:hypothetical protein
LAAQLADLAGGDIDQLELTADVLASWNSSVTTSSRASFQHRILLGQAINRLRPEYGKVVEYQASVADSLGRSTRWVQATMSVSASVDSALNDGVVLPLELCDLSWYGIPAAINNVREGRPLDFVPPKGAQQLTPEQQEAAVTKAYKALDKALDAVEDTGQRADLAATIIEKLSLHLDAAPEPEPEPEPEPPSPHRPGRRPRRHG